MSDAEILDMVQENEDNFKLLLEKYHPLLRTIATKFLENFKDSGYELEDLMQVASLGLIDAVRSYNNNKNTIFYTYMCHCVKNRLCNEYRSQKTSKKITLNNALYYDDIIPNSSYTYFDFLKNNLALDPYADLVDKEFEIAYTNYLNSLPLELAVLFEMKNTGCTVEEIAKFLKLDKRKVSSLFSRAKKNFLDIIK